jgi:hypothetical protein
MTQRFLKNPAFIYVMNYGSKAILPKYGHKGSQAYNTSCLSHLKPIETRVLVMRMLEQLRYVWTVSRIRIRIRLGFRIWIQADNMTHSSVAWKSFFKENFFNLIFIKNWIRIQIH